MRCLRLVVFTVAVLASPAQVQAQGLPAGKSAGVREAVLSGSGMVMLMGAGVAVLMGAVGVAWGGSTGLSAGVLAASGTSK